MLAHTTSTNDRCRQVDDAGPSVAMKLTGHKTESVYRRYAIVNESDLREAGVRLAALRLVADTSVKK